MAGFELAPKIYKLKFEDYPGLEVSAREPSTGKLLELQELGDEASTVTDVRKLFREFAEFLVSWNVTRDGEPVPADYDGLLSMGAGFVRKLTDGFIDAVTGVAPNLGKGLSSGAPSEEAALALASSSRSLGS